MKLILKVLATLALVIAIALTGTALLIGRSTTNAYRGYLSGYQRQRLTVLAHQAAAVYADTLSWQAVQAWIDQNAFITAVPGGGVGIERGMGSRGRNQSMSAGLVLVVDPVSGRPLARDMPALDRQIVDAGVPLVVQDREVAILVAASEGPALGVAEQSLLDQVSRAIGISAVVAGIAALLVGGLLVTSILRPLRRLEAGVARIACGDLEARIDIYGKDEIGQLAASFNQMATSLQHQETLRQRMVADVAHELRTPLSVIQGNLQAILDGVYPLERDEIQTLFDETRLLSRLVTDLHELAQAEAGQLPLAQQPVSVLSVLKHMASIFQTPSAQQNVRLVVELPTVDCYVAADPDRLQQILHNLLGNALRHTPSGGVVCFWVEVVLGVNGTSDHYTKFIRFFINDNGPGIPPNSLPFIFDRFYRADRSRVRDLEYTSGAGLGLAIARALAEAQNGSVDVQSQPGTGTTFWLDLPEALKDG